MTGKSSLARGRHIRWLQWPHTPEMYSIALGPRMPSPRSSSSFKPWVICKVRPSHSSYVFIVSSDAALCGGTENSRVPPPQQSTAVVPEVLMALLHPLCMLLVRRRWGVGNDTCHGADYAWFPMVGWWRWDHTLGWHCGFPALFLLGRRESLQQGQSHSLPAGAQLEGFPPPVGGLRSSGVLRVGDWRVSDVRCQGSHAWQNSASLHSHSST